MTILQRFARRVYNEVKKRGWGQYPDAALCEENMSYRLLRRTRDKEDGIVHLRDAKGLQLSLCVQGFAESTLDMDVKHMDVPTCVFCVAGMAAGLKHWRLEFPCHRRRIIEEGLRAGS